MKEILNRIFESEISIKEQIIRLPKGIGGDIPICLPPLQDQIY